MSGKKRKKTAELEKAPTEIESEKIGGKGEKRSGARSSKSLVTLCCAAAEGQSARSWRTSNSGLRFTPKFVRSSPCFLFYVSF
ncbi:hypothetical protein HaLaN_14263 [Haematococcus lacustris]|uniref:Uncharacterized protein n=1 Tax=Haematococcus lacustris TaxID=44745 RepID=A0A699ZE35_HAELA|nr:hypothetical protein HaLaN_14263 [Haematococcus lacustris]